MSLNLNVKLSTLVQVMAQWHKATSHYLSQCWPRSMSQHSVTRPQVWGLEKAADISNIFRCILWNIQTKIIFWFNFLWSLFLMVQLPISKHWFWLFVTRVHMNVKSWQSSNDLATLNVVAQFQEGSCSYFDILVQYNMKWNGVQTTH